MTQTKHYTAISCHEVGYSWQISAPETLSAEEVLNFQRALISWSDEPSQNDISALLADADYLDEFSLANVPELQKVRVDVRSVHREFWEENFEEVVAS